MIRAVRNATRLPVSLHICGRSLPLLPAMDESGADVLEIESDLAEACRVVKPQTALWGNLDPVRVLGQGTPALVGAEVGRVLETMRAAGRHRFVLSSGCTLSVDTPYGNLDALLGRTALSSN